MFTKFHVLNMLFLVHCLDAESKYMHVKSAFVSWNEFVLRWTTVLVENEVILESFLCLKRTKPFQRTPCTQNETFLTNCPELERQYRCKLDLLVVIR